MHKCLSMCKVLNRCQCYSQLECTPSHPMLPPTHYGRQSLLLMPAFDRLGQELTAVRSVTLTFWSVFLIDSHCSSDSRQGASVCCALPWPQSCCSSACISASSDSALFLFCLEPALCSAGICMCVDASQAYQCADEPQ